MRLDKYLVGVNVFRKEMLNRFCCPIIILLPMSKYYFLYLTWLLFVMFLDVPSKRRPWWPPKKKILAFSFILCLMKMKSWLKFSLYASIFYFSSNLENSGGRGSLFVGCYRYRQFYFYRPLVNNLETTLCTLSVQPFYRLN
jgi:hypothetical protein